MRARSSHVVSVGRATARCGCGGRSYTGSIAPRRPPEPDEPVEELVDELVDYAETPVSELAELAEEGAEPDERARRRWVLPLRIGVSLALLALLVWRIPDFDPAELVPTWDTTTPLWLGATLALMAIAVVASAVRWQQTLRALGHHLRLGRLTSTTWAGQFVSNVLPTTIGGDVLRIARISRDTGDAPETFASVALERLTGWLVLPLISLTGFLLDPALRDLGRATRVAVLIGLATLAGLIGILVLASHPRIGGRWADREGWQRFIGAVHLGVGRLRAHPSAAAGVLGAGIVYQVLLCLAAWTAAGAIGIDAATVTVLLAFYPAVLVAQVLPLGIAGLGVREGAFVLFLEPLGVPAEQAVALGLLLYLANLVVSLGGAPVVAFGRDDRRGRRGVPPADGPIVGSA